MTAQPPALSPGDIIPGWCSKCHERTPKRYQPEKFCKLKCLQCEAKEKENK